MTIQSFRGEYRWLSNFFKCDVVLWGQKFNTVENAYQSSKCDNMTDWLMMVNCKTPSEAKSKGRTINIRKDFDSVKLDIMYELLLQKFSDPYFKNKLIQTGNRLIIEGNRWGDTYWGVCDGIGDNHLGNLIMKIRTELIE
ncbi:swarming motility protein [Proteus phage 2207-N35]|nr:swarming motility protein [Proteus phage 2207-N35]